MAKTSIKKTAKNNKLSAKKLYADDVSRFVINQDGQIIYASDALLSFLDVTFDSISNHHANSFLSFDSDEAYSVTNSLSQATATDDPKDFKNIRPGCHTLSFQINGRETIKKDFQFDWLATPDAESYLIASTDTISDVAEAPETLTKLISHITSLQDNTPSKSKVKKTTKATKKKVSTSEQNIAANLKRTENILFTEMSNELRSVMEENGQFIRFNKNFGRLMGFQDDDLIGRNFTDFIHVDDRAQIRNALYSISSRNASVALSPAVHFETRMLGKQGGVFWIDWQLKNFDNIVYALGKDVTEIKNNESILKKKEAQLKEAQALAKMGHWYWDIECNHIEWSDEIYRIFSKEAKDFTPDIDCLNKLLHRRDTGRVIQAFQRAIIEKRNYDIDFRIYKDNGDIRYINCEGRCELDRNGEVIALFGIMQDVTERLQHERALQEAKDSAESAYAAKSRFLANMSHELRTPLNAIIGFSEMMQRQLLGPIGTEKYLDYLTGIRESGEHLLDLITDILDMSRIEAGKYELDLEHINLSKTVRLAAHMMEGRAVDAKIKLSVDIQNEDENIYVDRRALMQILLNLVSNAIKFTKAKGSVDISVSDTADDMIAIAVSDTGIGIPKHKINVITKPFEQVENEYSRHHDGSGLGLAITKDLTELHGGKLSIESIVGEGTTVTITLPKDTGKKLRKRK